MNELNGNEKKENTVMQIIQYLQQAYWWTYLRQGKNESTCREVNTNKATRKTKKIKYRRASKGYSTI